MRPKWSRSTTCPTRCTVGGDAKGWYGGVKRGPSRSGQWRSLAAPSPAHDLWRPKRAVSSRLERRVLGRYRPGRLCAGGPTIGSHLHQAHTGRKPLVDGSGASNSTGVSEGNGCQTWARRVRVRNMRYDILAQSVAALGSALTQPMLEHAHAPPAVAQHILLSHVPNLAATPSQICLPSPPAPAAWPMTP